MRAAGSVENRCNVEIRGIAPMGRAKLKPVPQAAAARRVDREPALDDVAAEAILDAVYDFSDGDGDLIVGVGYAVVAGTALWTIIGVIVVLLI